MKNIEEFVSVNKLHWESVTLEHTDSEYYPVELLKKGVSTLSQIEITDLGMIMGLKCAHLQCGIGLDSISLSRLGATITGFDISTNSISKAKEIASDCNENIEFVQSNIYDIDCSYFNKFDLVYTSRGVLRWLPDLDKWASTIHKLLKNGGFFYMFEIHPLVYQLTKNNDEIGIFGSYFDEEIKFKEIGQTHAIKLIHNDKQPNNVAHINWTLKSIFNNLIDNGLNIRSFNEFPFSIYNRHNLFPFKHDNLFYPAEKLKKLPFTFSIKAQKN